MNWIDNALAVDSQVLTARARRAEVLASNMANVDTPGYKARDIDFRSVLSGIREGEAAMSGVPARDGHFRLAGSDTYGIIDRPSVMNRPNGNTVSREFEQTAFAQNSIQYLASLRFLSGNVQGLLKALRGD